MSKCKRIFAFLRILLILPGIRRGDAKFRMDLQRWKEIHHLICWDTSALALLLWDFPEFRSLFIYRNRSRRLYRTWARLVYPPMRTLFLETRDIGGGLYIQHGFSTMIAAESIGENCWINQQVTIGYNGHSSAPVIGNNVMITCGAKVLGGITVGDGAIIGANAVVIRDVAPGAVMGGVPARSLK